MSAADRYVLGDEIARGGMGAVYRAADTALGREVAVKVLLDTFAPTSAAARRFADEAHIAGQLQHPGIPPVHELGTLADGRPFLAMKLIKGDTLDDLLKQRPDPAADRGRFVAVFEAVCQAVGFAHARGVVHRDLKPANVMVGAFGEVQVLDWGLAKQLRNADFGMRNEEPDDPNSTTDLNPHSELRIPHSGDPLTRAGSVLGTPAYMPPEQAIGAVDQIDRRSDVFGLGGILAAVLTGRPPFAGDTAESTRQLAAKGKVEGCFARLDACGAEPDLVALCKRCLAPEPADRPADAGAVAAAVAGLRADAEARARQAELDRVKAEATAAELRKRRRVQRALAAAVVLIAAGAGGVAVWRANEDAAKRVEALRREGEEAQRRQAEAERAARAADAVAALLDQAKAALEAGDAGRAAPLLAQADRRAADDAVADPAGRRAAYGRDLAMLRALDAVNDFRWMPGESKVLPPPAAVAAEWAKAFADYGLVPGTTPPAAAAARVTTSPIRAALVAGLDGWLARSRSAAVRDLLAAADPDPFRDEVRGRLAAGDAAALAALAGRAEWAAQPSGLALAFGNLPGVPAAAERNLLLRLATARRADFPLLMHFGSTYPANSAAGAAPRAGYFRAAAAVRPDSVVALNNLGLALADLGEFDPAEAAYREAIRLAPGYPLPHYNLGTCLFDRKDFAGAAAAFREAVRLAPGRATFVANLGAALVEQKDWAGAEAAYREAIRLAPTDAFPHNGLGIVRYERRDLAGAEAAYREALRLDPANAKAHNNLGNLFRDRNQPDAAAAAYREAIRLDPAYARPHNGLGNLLRATGEPAAAAAAYRAAIRLDPTFALPHNGLGNVLSGQKDWDGAAAAYREAIRLDPRLIPPHHGLGNLLRAKGDPAGAAAAYREAIRLDPAGPHWHNALGTALADQKDWAAAAAAYREAVRLDPGFAVAHNNLGGAYERLLDLGRAEAAYREAVRLSPRLGAAHANLGDALRKQGRYAEAAAAYRASLALPPPFRFARDGLDFCERVLRGEVPPAPPPRPAAR